jgi:hypothetical protein
LLTTTLALLRQAKDEVGARRLTNYLEKERIFFPQEDQIPIPYEREIAQLVSKLGAPRVNLMNHITEKILVDAVDLQVQKPWNYFRASYVVSIFPEDHSFLISSGFDDFFTVVAGKRKQLEPLKLAQTFEGFWCDEKTRACWFMSEDEYQERTKEMLAETEDERTWAKNFLSKFDSPNET